MPRGAEYSDGTPASDNAIEAGENKIAGAPKEGNVCTLHVAWLSEGKLTLK